MRQIAYRRAPSTTRFAFFYGIPRLKNFVASCEARSAMFSARGVACEARSAMFEWPGAMFSARGVVPEARSAVFEARSAVFDW